MLRLGKKGGGFLGFLKKTYTKVVKGFSDLPTTTKNWTFAGAIVFFAGCLMGGKVMEAAFIAGLATLGVWTLFIEKPTLAKWALKVGFLADFMVTCVAFIFMPATVSAGFAVAFFAWFFTCARLGIADVLPALAAKAKARREAAEKATDAMDMDDDEGKSPLTFPGLKLVKGGA